MTKLRIVTDTDQHRRAACLDGASLLEDLIPSIKDADMRERADSVCQALLLASLPDGCVDYRGDSPRVDVAAIQKFMENVRDDS